MRVKFYFHDLCGNLVVQWNRSVQRAPTTSRAAFEVGESERIICARLSTQIIAISGIDDENEGRGARKKATKLAKIRLIRRVYLHNFYRGLDVDVDEEINVR